MGEPLRLDPIAEAGRQWDRHWGNEATDSMLAVTSIMRVYQVLMAHLNELLQPLRLTFPRYEALMLLYYSRQGSLPLGKMGERLQVHRSSVTNTVDGLQELGLVARVAHTRDRRTTLASITELGRETAERATRVLNEDRFGMGALRPDQLEELFETLRLVRSRAEDFREDQAAEGAGSGYS